MRWLLDINVLIALIDRQHQAHRRTAIWFDSYGLTGWISSPTTQNGTIRIMSNAAYGAARKPPSQVVNRLRNLMAISSHEFIADDETLLNGALIEVGQLRTGASITDAYLLALAVSHGCQLATLDGRLDPSAVRDGAAHLLVIE
jgi:toxin-antitoxin system PIN domain toxin